MKITKQLSSADQLRVENITLLHENITLKTRLCQDELARLQKEGQDVGKKLVELRTEFAETYGMVSETITIRRDGLIEGEGLNPEGVLEPAKALHERGIDLGPGGHAPALGTRE